MIGARVRRAAATKPPRPKRCSLYRWLNGLPDALEALGPHADELAGPQQPLGVGVAGERVAGLPCDLTHHRHLEDEVRAQHAQVAMRGVLVVEGHLGHRGIQGDDPGVVAHDQRARVGRHVLEPGGLDPEPRPVQRPHQRQEDLVGQLGVEAEVVHPVVTGHPPAHEVQPALVQRDLVVGPDLVRRRGVARVDGCGAAGRRDRRDPGLGAGRHAGSGRLGAGVADEARGLRGAQRGRAALGGAAALGIAGLAEGDDVCVRQRRTPGRTRSGSRRP